MYHITHTFIPKCMILFQETVISEREEDKGVFLCGPEWKVIFGHLGKRIINMNSKNIELFS